MASTEKAQEILEQLHEGVEALVSGDDWQAALEQAARFHSYSFGNLLLIALQYPSASAVAGFNAWKKLGRSVRKGERGIRILAPMIGKREVEDEATGETETRKVVRGFRAVCVFAYEQTEGEELATTPLPQLLEGEAPEGALAAIREQIEGAGYSFSLEAPAYPGANGTTEWDSKAVKVAPELSEAQQLKTAIHELAHILLHAADAEAKGPLGCRGRVEVEAESVAFVVGSALGLEAAGYSFPYVATWAAGDSDLIQKTGQRVVKAAASILDTIAPQAQQEDAA